MVFFTWLAVLLGLISGCLAIFGYLDRHPDPKFKLRVSNMLNGVLPAQVSDKWASIFVDAFDRLFGLRFMSLRFFAISATFSVSFCTLLILTWATIYPNEASFYLQNPGAMILVFGVLLMVANIIPDYISNCQTRYILKRLMYELQSPQHPSVVRSYVIWLAIDVSLTTALSAVIIIPISYFLTNEVFSVAIFATVEIPEPFALTRFLALHSTEVRTYTSDDGNPGYNVSFTPPYGIFFYTTFFTTIWSWMFILSGMFVRIIRSTIGPNSAIFRFFGFQQHPLWAQGAGCAILLATAYLVATLFYCCF